jgi:hypothetical protein
MKKFKTGDRVKRLGYNHEGYTVIGYNGAGSVIVLPVGKKEHWSNYDIFIEQELTKARVGND